MEPYRYKPYGFTELHQIMDLHIRQVNRHLCRYIFTEKEYLGRVLPKYPTKFVPFIYYGMFDMVVIIGLCCAYFNKSRFFQNYNHIIRSSFGVTNPEKLSFCYLVVTLGIVDAVYLTFYWAIHYKARVLDALYEMRANLDREISSRTAKNKFLLFFNLASFQTGINLKLSAIGMTYMVLYVIKYCYLHYSQNIVSIYDSIGITLFFIGVQMEFYEIQYLIYALLCGLFFILKTFKFKTRGCMTLLSNLRKNVIKNNHLVNVYTKKFMDLHRLMNYYNTQVREYNFVMDTIGKVANGWGIINFFKSRDGFSLLFLILFSGLYLYSHFMAERMSFYKQIVPIMNNDLHAASCRFSQSFPTKNQFAKKKLAVLLKIEKNIDFLSCSTNQFGFTYGQQYHYTKLKVVENTLMFGYALLLITKRSRG